MANILKKRYVGKFQTYDIEVDSNDHQFYLNNGILTSNSHAVAYAIDSYQSAYLLTYYPEEWLCSYIESNSGISDKQFKAISEAKSLGYNVVDIDINYASDEWQILPNKTFMPSFLTVKGIGEIAVEEILKNRPYSSIYDFLWNPDGSWKHKKVNKKILDILTKIEAFDSLDIIGKNKLFLNYKHMNNVIVQNINLLKNKNGKEKFNDIIEKCSNNTEDWTLQEKFLHLEDLIGNINVQNLISKEVLKFFKEKNIIPINEVQNDKNVCWFLIMDSKIKKTKTNKDYALLTVVGNNGNKLKIYCWSVNKNCIFNKYSPYISKIKLNEFGYSTNIWNIKEITL